VSVERRYRQLLRRNSYHRAVVIAIFGAGLTIVGVVKALRELIAVARCSESAPLSRTHPVR